MKIAPRQMRLTQAMGDEKSDPRNCGSQGNVIPPKKKRRRPGHMLGGGLQGLPDSESAAIPLALSDLIAELPYFI